MSVSHAQLRAKVSLFLSTVMVIIVRVLKYDKLVKTQIIRRSVIPAQAGIQLFQYVLDSRLRGNDEAEDFLRVHQI